MAVNKKEKDMKKFVGGAKKLSQQFEKNTTYG
jgi:hypothetical protein